MAGFLDALAEARIREWQRRVAAGEVSATEALPLNADSWESQLFKEVVALRLAARDTEDPAEARRLRERAEGLRIQLMVALEADRPRLAQVLAARLATT